MEGNDEDTTFAKQTKQNQTQTHNKTQIFAISELYF